MVKTRQPELPHAGDGKADQQRERSLSYLNAIQAGMCCKRAGRAPANPQRMVNAGICRNAAGAIWRGIIRPIRGARSRSLTILTQDRSRRARRGARRRKPSTGHGPLLPPLIVFGAVVLFGAAYVTYVLWPRWPDSPVTLNAPTVPIVVSGTVFNIEPAAIRMNVQRRPGAHERVDLSYMWPSLTPPDHAIKPTVGAPIDPNERLFVTIASGETTLPLMERLQTIYPRYLVAEPVAGPPGLTFRGFRSETPYQGEDLVFEPNAPEHFLARCSQKGVTNSGTCLLERRIGKADVTLRFPRDWLDNWSDVASGIDRLIARLHPETK